MKQCPRCGRYLKFKMVYNCGIPIIGWDFVCGYDSFKNEHTVVTTATDTYYQYVEYKGEQNESNNNV